jgi:hypothetical protein
MKKDITKARNDENTKKKKIGFRVFVIKKSLLQTAQKYFLRKNRVTDIHHI